MGLFHSQFALSATRYLVQSRKGRAAFELSPSQAIPKPSCPHAVLACKCSPNSIQHYRSSSRPQTAAINLVHSTSFSRCQQISRTSHDLNSNRTLRLPPNGSNVGAHLIEKAYRRTGEAVLPLHPPGFASRKLYARAARNELIYG